MFYAFCFSSSECNEIFCNIAGFCQGTAVGSEYTCVVSPVSVAMRTCERVTSRAKLPAARIISLCGGPHAVSGGHPKGRCLFLLVAIVLPDIERKRLIAQTTAQRRNAG